VVSLISTDSHITIGALVLDVFEDSIAPLINSSLELAEGEYMSS